MTFTRRRLLAPDGSRTHAHGTHGVPGIPRNRPQRRNPPPTSASSARTPAGTYDVVVVGSGGAALGGALRRGRRRLGALIEKTAVLGGNTLRASGLFNAADPERQRPMGDRRQRRLAPTNRRWPLARAATIPRSCAGSSKRLSRPFIGSKGWGSGSCRKPSPPGARVAPGHKPLLPRGTATSGCSPVRSSPRAAKSAPGGR